VELGGGNNSALPSLGGSTGSGVRALEVGGVRPTSGGTGGGRSLPRRAGREMIPAIAAAAIATARPRLCQRICLALTHG
jgi:hypothetical protein